MGSKGKSLDEKATVKDFLTVQMNVHYGTKT